MKTPRNPSNDSSRFIDRSFDSRQQSQDRHKKYPPANWRGHKVRKNATGDMTKDQVQLRNELFGKEEVDTSDKNSPRNAPFANTPETRTLLGQIITQLSSNGAEGLPKRDYVVTVVKG